MIFTIGPAIASLDSSFVADVHLPLLGGAASAAIAANPFLSSRIHLALTQIPPQIKMQRVLVALMLGAAAAFQRAPIVRRPRRIQRASTSALR